MSGATPHCQAQSYLEKMNPNRPFLCRKDIVFALACVSIVHRNEMSKTGSLRMSLAVRQRLSAAALCLAVQQPQSHSVSGTLAPDGTSNNTLHAELKGAFRQTTRLHQAILATNLCVIRVEKILSHAGAYLRPTTRQMTQGMVLCRMLRKDFLIEAA